MYRGRYLGNQAGSRTIFHLILLSWPTLKKKNKPKTHLKLSIIWMSYVWRKASLSIGTQMSYNIAPKKKISKVEVGPSCHDQTSAGHVWLSSTNQLPRMESARKKTKWVKFTITCPPWHRCRATHRQPPGKYRWVVWGFLVFFFFLLLLFKIEKENNTCRKP